MLAPSGNKKRTQVRKSHMSTIQAKAQTHWLAPGHVPMLSSPKQVAAVIIEAANTPFTALHAAHASAQSVFPANFRTQGITSNLKKTHDSQAE